MQTPSNTFTVGELATLGGVKRRTIRYYVQRELLPPPEGVGRGARYTRQHLHILTRIRELQDQGLTLAEIADTLARPPARIELTPEELDTRRSHWTRIPLSSDVEIHIQTPPTTFPLERLERFQRIVHLCFELCQEEEELP